MFIKKRLKKFISIFLTITFLASCLMGQASVLFASEQDINNIAEDNSEQTTKISDFSLLEQNINRPLVTKNKIIFPEQFIPSINNDDPSNESGIYIWEEKYWPRPQKASLKPLDEQAENEFEKSTNITEPGTSQDNDIVFPVYNYDYSLSSPLAMLMTAEQKNTKENPLDFLLFHDVDVDNNISANNTRESKTNESVIDHVYSNGTSTDSVIDEVYEHNQNQNSTVKDQVYSNETITDLVINHDKNQDSTANLSAVNKPELDTQPEYSIRNKGGHYTAGFSRKSDNKLMEFTHANASLFISPLNPNSVSGKVYQNTVLYENIYQDTNFRYTAEQYSLKEEIIVNKYTGMSEFPFQFSVRNVDCQEYPNGEIHFSDLNTGKTLFYLTKPFALDNDGKRCDNIKLEISPKKGLIKISVDPEWLKNASYPIIIDPTIVLQGEVYNFPNSGTVQGYQNWYYEEELPNGNYNPMTWNSSTRRWEGSDGIAHIESHVFPGNNNVVFTWEAPHSGTVNIHGSAVMHYFLASGTGDGVNIKILKNSTKIWPDSDWQYIADDYSFITHTQDIYLPVETGDNIRFIVNKNINSDDDYLWWVTYISYIDCYHQASAGFGNTQGHNNWYYDEKRLDDNLYPMTWSSAENLWVGASSNKVASNWQLPGAYDSVRTWKAPYSGVVAVSGNAYKLETGGGDGVKLYIYKNNTSIWNQNLAYNNSTGIGHQVTIPVNAGDDLRFIVNQNANNSCDKTAWDPVISYYSMRDTSGFKSYWNYSNMSLGGGWNASVNTYNLNLVLGKTLFTIPGRGFPLGESITYNSMDLRGGPLGQSWHLGSDITVIENNNGDVVYNAGDGSIYTFKPDGSGGYIAPAGVYLIMEKVGSGNFTITDKNQNVYTFQDNKITQATDRNGNITSYEYINGRLNKVTDPSMRCADYSYYPDGKLWKIITPNNNSYEFVYNGDKITQIIDPLGVVDISYGIYGDQLIFTDPLNRVSSFNLNSNRQVVNVRDARTTGSDIYQTNFNQTIQDNNIVTTVTDPGNRSFTYYHDPNTGNLTKYANQMDGIWQYTWANNNMTSAQDAKGTTNYEYDNRGNVTKETRILDSYPSHNIVQRMYYDQNNRLTSYIDGNGVEQKFSYDIKGSLLSSYDENRKEAIGKKYDQYGNVVEDNPALSSTINLLTNGSFEDIAPNGIPAGWERFGSGAVLTTEGFNSHGQKALKFQTNTYVDNYVSRTLSFPYQFPLGTCLTISADIKCENVTNGYIKIVYGEDFEDEFNFKGNGTTTVIFNSELPSDDYCPVYIRLGIKGTGAISFDSVQVEYIGAGDYYTASAFSTIENGNFEHSGSHWNFTGATPTYPNTTSFAGKRSARLNLTASGTATLYQDVPVYPGEMLTLSGMVKVSNVEAGDGAYYKIDYYDNSPTPQLISTFQTGYLTGSNDWTRLVCLANAPMNAKFGRVTCVLNGTGTAYFDAVKLVSRMTYKYDYDPAGNYPIMIEDNLSNRTYHYYNNNTGRKTQFTDALSNNEYYYYDNSNRLIQVTDRLQNSAYYVIPGVPITQTTGI